MTNPDPRQQLLAAKLATMESQLTGIERKLDLVLRELLQLKSPTAMSESLLKLNEQILQNTSLVVTRTGRYLERMSTPREDSAGGDAVLEVLNAIQAGQSEGAPERDDVPRKTAKKPKGASRS